MEPRQNGTPASRPRVWLVCFPCSFLVSNGVREQSLSAVLDACLDAIAGCALSPMDAYLLPDGHSYITTRLAPTVYAKLCHRGLQSTAAVVVNGLLPRQPFRHSDPALSHKWPAVEILSLEHFVIRFVHFRIIFSSRSTRTEQSRVEQSRVSNMNETQMHKKQQACGPHGAPLGIWHHVVAKRKSDSRHAVVFPWPCIAHRQGDGHLAA